MQQFSFMRRATHIHLVFGPFGRFGVVAVAVAVAAAAAGSWSSLRSGWSHSLFNSTVFSPEPNQYWARTTISERIRTMVKRFLWAPIRGPKPNAFGPNWISLIWTRGTQFLIRNDHPYIGVLAFAPLLALLLAHVDTLTGATHAI